MDTPIEFYSGDVEERRFRYMISKHEVKNWIEKNGVENLIELIERVNLGDDFNEVYNKSR